MTQRETTVFGLQPTSKWEEAQRNVPAFNARFNIADGVVGGVHVGVHDKPAALTDAMYNVGITAVVGPLHRRLPLAMSDNPNTLPFGEARLGGPEGLEIPRLARFLGNIALLDRAAETHATTQAQTLGRRSIMPWFTLRYQERQAEPRLIFLYKRATGDTANKHAALPFLHDVAVADVLDGTVEGTMPYDAPIRGGGDNPDSYASFTYDHKQLWLEIRQTYHQTVVHGFSLTTDAMGSLDAMVRRKEGTIPVQQLSIWDGLQTDTWQRLVSAPCGPPNPTWY